MQKLYALLTFYRQFITVNLVLNAMCCYALFQWKHSAYIPMLLCGRIASHLLLFFLWHTFYPEHAHYYRNLGVRRRALLTLTAAADIAVLALLLTCIYLLQ